MPGNIQLLPRFNMFELLCENILISFNLYKSVSNEVDNESSGISRLGSSFPDLSHIDRFLDRWICLHYTNKKNSILSRKIRPATKSSPNICSYSLWMIWFVKDIIKGETERDSKSEERHICYGALAGVPMEILHSRRLITGLQIIEQCD